MIIKNFHVFYNTSSKKWVVQKEGNKRPFRTLTSKKEASEIGNKLAKDSNSNVIVHNKTTSLKKISNGSYISQVNTNQSKKNNTIYKQKSELDQFYTNVDIAKKCYDKVCKIYNIKDFSMILEPSAGSGSFFYLLPKDKRKGLDLDPKCKEVEKMDFFEYKNSINGKIMTIGNPPFGRICSLAIKFFNHSANFSEVIAFIIPKTFKKQSLQNKLDLNFHLVFSEDLPKDSFVFNDEPYDVPCCFQIWEKRNIKRVKKIVSLENDIFDFVSKTESDFAVRRVGGLAGKCQANLDLAAEVSHYFLKIKDKSIKKNELIAFINNLDVSEIINSTVGVKSLSKPEFVEIFLKNYVSK